MDAWELRHVIYSQLAARGTAPSRGALAAMAGDRVEELLLELHQRHAIVLDDAGEIRMALPFSAVPSNHRVVAGDRSWWANCAWDALAIPSMLRTEARIEAQWVDTAEAVDLRVVDGQLTTTSGNAAGWVRFAFPAHRWWDDIVET